MRSTRPVSVSIHVPARDDVISSGADECRPHEFLIADGDDRIVFAVVALVARVAGAGAVRVLKERQDEERVARRRPLEEVEFDALLADGFAPFEHGTAQ